MTGLTAVATGGDYWPEVAVLVNAGG